MEIKTKHRSEKITILRSFFRLQFSWQTNTEQIKINKLNGVIIVNLIPVRIVQSDLSPQPQPPQPLIAHTANSHRNPLPQTTSNRIKRERGREREREIFWTKKKEIANPLLKKFESDTNRSTKKQFFRECFTSNWIRIERRSEPESAPD